MKIAGINFPPYVQSVQPGQNTTIDNTDEANPKVNTTGGGGGGALATGTLYRTSTGILMVKY